MKIWRYVDLPKFVNMLSTGTLHFACVSSFQDPYEGWLPRSYIEAMVNLIRTDLDQIRQTQHPMVAHNPPLHRVLENAIQDVERKLHMPRLLKEINEKFGASCWHINEGESVAMWRLYGPSGAGIAIESTRERLEAAMKDSAPHPVHIDPVRYMDFDNDPINRGGIDPAGLHQAEVLRARAGATRPRHAARTGERCGSAVRYEHPDR